jgi:RNA polymerase sigma-70 factor, ECF subfamily
MADKPGRRRQTGDSLGDRIPLGRGRARLPAISFVELELHRSSLVLHCYRMLGSIHDAEDLAQETLARAWRAIAGFEGRSSIRTWLFRIATRQCLDLLQGRNESFVRAGAIDPEALVAVAVEPFPDDVARAQEKLNPEARYSARESIQAAFLAAIHNLTPNARAAPILRDVLGWPASEVGDLLGWTPGAVHVALHRARATIRAARNADLSRTSVSTQQRELLQEYIEAWEKADWSRLASLLRRDVVFRMPPQELLIRGPSAVASFFSQQIGPTDHFLMKPTRANGRPAFAAYLRRRSERTFHAHAVQTLAIRGSAIAGIVTFLDATLIPKFGLPATIKRRTGTSQLTSQGRLV